MKNFSEENVNNLITNKDRTINIMRSLSGLSIDHIQKLYESQKIDDISDENIIIQFRNLAKPITNINLKEFFGSFVNGLESIVENGITDIKKTGITQGILKALNDYTLGNDEHIMLDTVQLLSIVKELIKMKDPDADFSKIDSNLILGNVNNEFSILSESINFNIPEKNIENTILLFEGLKEILMKNNKRWGNAHHIQNTYNAMLLYFDEQLKELKLKESMVSMDDTFHLELVNDLLTGNVNPIYKHINGVKNLIPDLQTLLFDLTLLTNFFMLQNKWALNLISRQTVNDYNIAAKDLIASIASSRFRSKIIFTAVRNGDGNPYGELVTSDSDFNETEWNKLDFLKYYSENIDNKKITSDLYDPSLRGIINIVDLIKSSSSEFNLKIRPFIRNFVTKSYELLSKVEKAKMLRQQRQY